MQWKLRQGIFCFQKVTEYNCNSCVLYFHWWQSQEKKNKNIPIKGNRPFIEDTYANKSVAAAPSPTSSFLRIYQQIHHTDQHNLTYANALMEQGFFEVEIVQWSCLYMEKSRGNFLLILQWGYSVLGAIIHLAVRGSLSAMHTRVVHGVWAQSQNVREWPCFFSWNAAARAL